MTARDLYIVSVPRGEKGDRYDAFLGYHLPSLTRKEVRRHILDQVRQFPLGYGVEVRAVPRSPIRARR